MPTYVKHDSRDLVNPAEYDSDTNTLTFELANPAGPPAGISFRFKGVTPNALAKDPTVTVTVTTSSKVATASIPVSARSRSASAHSR